MELDRRTALGAMATGAVALAAVGAAEAGTLEADIPAAHGKLVAAAGGEGNFNALFEDADGTLRVYNIYINMARSSRLVATIRRT